VTCLERCSSRWERRRSLSGWIRGWRIEATNDVKFELIPALCESMWNGRRPDSKYRPSVYIPSTRAASAVAGLNEECSAMDLQFAIKDRFNYASPFRDIKRNRWDTHLHENVPAHASRFAIWRFEANVTCLVADLNSDSWRVGEIGRFDKRASLTSAVSLDAKITAQCAK